MKFQSVCYLISLLITVECSEQQAPMKFATLYIYEDFIHAQGAWLPDKLTEENEPMPSETDVACYKHGGNLIVSSDAYCIVATAQIIFGNPHIDVTYYPVLSWDKNRIIAADSPTEAMPICIWSQVTVNLQDKTVTVTDNRKLGKGHEGLNNVCLKLPLTETYHLVDTASELMRRALSKGHNKKPE
jgi:hypothetical protein